MTTTYQNVVLDVNIFVRTVEVCGGIPDATTYAGTELSRLLGAAWTGRRTRDGRVVRVVLSRHIIDTAVQVLSSKLGLVSERDAQLWLVGIANQLLGSGTGLVDQRHEDYDALERRAEQPDGCKDAFGNPDAEDEAVLRLVLDTDAVLFTFESDVNFPTYARRRGATVGDIKGFLASLRGPTTVR